MIGCEKHALQNAILSFMPQQSPSMYVLYVIKSVTEN